KIFCSNVLLTRHHLVGYSLKRKLRTDGQKLNGHGIAALLHRPLLAPQKKMFEKSKESMKCNQCDRSFRKASELTLHQYTHDIEKHHARNRMFQCPECRIPLRTKALLAKHLEASHGSH
ncbi:zinc finger, C2H2 type, partial [Ancylostoma duodenale]